MFEKYKKYVNYWSGVGLHIGFSEPPSKKTQTKLTQCKCGLTTHLTSISKDFPFNKINVKIATNSVDKNAEIDHVAAKNNAPTKHNRAGKENVVL